MPKDNPATTGVNEVEIVGVAITLSPTKTGTVHLRKDVADYFGVTVSSSSSSHRLITRNYTGKKVFGGVYENTGKNSTAGAGSQKFYLPLNLDQTSGGRVIVVPTELTIVKGTGENAKTYHRVTSMRFPSGAILSQISDWLATKCTTKKPGWFRTPSGHKYVVAPAPAGVTDLNPGEGGGGT